jgi:type IV pilus assembly protein PilA
MNPRSNPSDGFTRFEIIFSVVVLVIVTLFVVREFNRVRTLSSDKAVLGNLCQLAAGADQYYLENRVTVAAFSAIVGPTNYIKALNTVAGEAYPAILIQGVAITASGVANARTITYMP